MIPKVSIIVPAFNCEKTLSNCLNSILNQTHKNFEVIIVDNNSYDRTREIIKGFEFKDKRVKYVFEQQIGRGAARHKGEMAAKGDIILMTDADCIVPVNWINEMINPIIAGDFDAVQGSDILKSNNFNNGDIIGNIDTKNFAISFNTLKVIGFTNSNYVSGNDTDLSIRLHKHNVKIKFLLNVKVKHKLNSSLELFKKQFIRAFWCTKITKDNINILLNTDFLYRTNQTPYTFIKFFPGLFISLIVSGFKYTYFDLISGSAWRIGLIWGMIRN